MSTSSTSTDRSSVFVCSNDDAAINTLESVFSSLASYEVKRSNIDALLLADRLDSEAFDLAIIDIEDGSILKNLEFLRVRRSFGKLPVIFISDSLDQEDIRSLIKLEGADWLSKPLNSKALIETINTITHRQQSAANKVHAVLSCGGGSGGTSAAIMLAHYLMHLGKRKTTTTALFDLDFSKADIGAYLNVENEYHLESVIENTQRVDLEFIDVIKKVHDSGFTLLSFECPPLSFSAKGAELVLKLLDLVSFQHDHTVLDLSSYVTSWHPSILAGVDTVTIVSGSSVPSLQRAKNMYKNVAALRNSEKGIHIIVNRVKSGLFGSLFGKKELLKLFDPPSLTILPEEQDVMLEALNRGVLPIEVNGRSVFCSRIRDLAETLRKEVN